MSGIQFQIIGVMARFRRTGLVLPPPVVPGNTLIELGILERARFDMAEALEEHFKISLEREEISAWETVQSVFDSVINQYTARVETDEERLQKPWLEAARVKPKPAINGIQKQDVDDFRNGNYCERTALDQYQHIATKSAIYPGRGTPLGLLYVALKLNGEAGELAEHVGKAMRDDGYISAGTDRGDGSFDAITAPLTPDRREKIIKEIGDVLWYLSAACNELGISLTSAAIGNLEKLHDRTQRDALRGSGDER